MSAELPEFEGTGPEEVEAGFEGNSEGLFFSSFEARHDRSCTRNTVSRRTDVDWNAQFAGTLLCIVQRDLRIFPRRVRIRQNRK